MGSNRYEIDQMPEVVPDDDRIAVRFANGRVHLWKPHRFRNFLMLATKALDDYDKRPDNTVALPPRPRIVRAAGEEM